MTKTIVGVIGSGAISGIYLTNMIQRFHNLQVKGIASAHYENAKKKADESAFMPMPLRKNCWRMKKLTWQ